MFAIAHFRRRPGAAPGLGSAAPGGSPAPRCPILASHRRRSGSVLLPALFVVIIITMLLGAILPLTLSGYGLSRADRDRAEALTAAEAGLNWEIGRINNRLWNKTDSGATGPVDGSGNPTTMDYW